jgi:hypothetical protein
MGEVSHVAAAAWIEILSRQHDVIARHRVAALPATVGRAYDNDVVVDDPHVAPHHLRIARREDGTLHAEDLGSRNGLFAGRDRVRRDEVALDDDTVLRIGATLVRVRTSTHAVAPEEPIAHRASAWPAAVACIAGVLALAVLELWLGETAEPKAIRYFMPLLILAVLVAVWTTGWSIVARVFTGHARFGLHFLIVAAGLLAYSAYDQIAEIGAFAVSWSALATSSYVVAWIVLGGICLAHLLAINRAHKALKIGVALVLAAAGIAMQTLKVDELRANYGQPVTLRRLEPPALRLVAPQREAAFFTDSAALRDRLDEARTEEPADGDAGGDADD